MTWMIEHADDLRAAAQERRNRGLPTGKQAAGWANKRPDPEAGSFERVRAEIKARLRDHWAVRFWHYGNSAVLIRIAAGQTLTHHSYAVTDEGWSSEANEWEFDGETLTARWYNDGCDCDGRLSRDGESHCAADRVRAGYVDPDDATIQYPAWEQGRRGQRDYSAEVMGY